MVTIFLAIWIEISYIKYRSGNMILIDFSFQTLLYSVYIIREDSDSQ